MLNTTSSIRFTGEWQASKILQDVVVAWIIVLPWHLLKETKSKYEEHPFRVLRLRSRFEVNTHKMQVSFGQLSACFRSGIDVYMNVQFIAFIFCILIWGTILCETVEETRNRGEKQYSDVCESMWIATTKLHVPKCNFEMSITTCHKIFTGQMKVLNEAILNWKELLVGISVEIFHFLVSYVKI